MVIITAIFEVFLCIYKIYPYTDTISTFIIKGNNNLMTYLKCEHNLVGKSVVIIISIHFKTYRVAFTFTTDIEPSVTIVSWIQTFCCQNTVCIWWSWGWNKIYSYYLLNQIKILSVLFPVYRKCLFTALQSILFHSLHTYITIIYFATNTFSVYVLK